jgi:hypothetical protein
MTRAIAVTSAFDQHKTVTVDPWATNPLLDDATQVAPATVQAATVSQGEAPKMFSGGASDLPPFLASGVDPQVLIRLPYQLRHQAAMEADPAKVLDLLENQGHSDVVMGQPAAAGLADYTGRMHDWLAGKWTNPAHAETDPVQAAAADDAVFNAVFGPTVAAHDAKVAAVNAAAKRSQDARNWRHIAGDPTVGRAQR